MNDFQITNYQRVTVSLWRRCHRDLGRPPLRSPQVEAAMHAVLPDLRAAGEPAALFARYEANTLADFALLGSLLPADPPEELLWQVRDAAFYLRWRELGGAP